MSHEVIVIGGGPAGLGAAIELARGGSSVLLCEQSSEPEAKPCGEGLLPSALGELTSLGVELESLMSVGHALHGVRYFSQRGVRAEGRFVGGAGLGLRRNELQRLLRRIADTTPGLDYHRGTARVVCQAVGCGVRLGDAVLSPRLVVAADGLASRARRDAGFAYDHPGPRRYGVRQHFAATPWSDHVEVHFHGSGEAYVTPVAADELNVAILWQASSPAPPRPGPHLVPALLERFPLLAQRLRGAHPVERARARGPLRVRVRSPARDGLVLVGDAAGYVDAITGEGVGLSLAKSRLLARHVLPLLRRAGGPISRRGLRPYLRAARQLERAHVQLTRALLWVRRAPWLVERVVGALAEDPVLFEHLLRANQGEVHPLALPARSAWALWQRVLAFRPPRTGRR